MRAARVIEGWILDIYPTSSGMCVWVSDGLGQPSCLIDSWSPSFYLKARPQDELSINRLLQSFHSPFSLRTVEKRDFFTNQSSIVIEVQVQNPFLYSPVVDRFLQVSQQTANLKDKIELFNADLNLMQAYFYEKDLFPLAHCLFKIDKQNRIQECQLIDNCWHLDYELPPFRYAHLGFESIHGGDSTESSFMDPNQSVGGGRGRGRRGGYVLTLGRELGKGTSYLMNESEEELILSLNRHIADWDPDIILSDWGDSYIMPRLQMHAKRSGVPLCLSRDPKKQISKGSQHSFFSYGQIYFKAGPRTLFGRLHIDTKNSFMVSQSNLEGIIEVARVAKIPIQRAARCTIGTSLSSIQQAWAIKNNYLIPIDKGQTEDFRGADEFIASDRGGLVYEPEMGWHEDLIEFDFVSMYPEIMIRHNVTPEAINCDCCPDNKVPEIGHHICRNRLGMVPQTLKPIVEKRAAYKKKIQEDHPNKVVYKRRSDAFKWALVCCFGYLGYRNARFGKIEAHECVNAYSREALLKAKEAAEEDGFHFLHAIVDSLWLRKPGVTPEQIKALQKKIEKRTGLPLGFEGQYRWIRFMSSRINPRVGVPNRYIGAFTNGELKVRGIETRRHDTPPFIFELQNQLLDVMAEARNLAELDRLKIRCENIVESFRERLKSGHVSPLELALTFRLSREPSAYIHDTLSGLAAKKLAASGVTVHPGEMIRYVIAGEHDRIKDWRVTPLSFIEDYFEYDIDYYEKLIRRAIDITPYFPLVEEKRKSRVRGKAQRQLMLPGFTFS